MPKGYKRKLSDQPQYVINRWFAIKVIRIFRPYIEGVLRVYLRVRLVFQERKRYKTLEAAFETTLEEFKKLSSTEFEELKVFFNLSLFFLIAERDIQAVKIDALSHPDKWKRNISIRIILLVIHEWDMAKVAPANKLNEAYEAAGISQDSRNEMTAAFRKINKAHAKAKKLLARARHSTIAHRDANALLQYEIISKLDAKETLNIAACFYEGADLFIQALPKLMLEAGSFPSLLKQYGNHA